MKLGGRTVLVTGAARGIGRSPALACAGAGAGMAIGDVWDRALEVNVRQPSI